MFPTLLWMLTFRVGSGVESGQGDTDSYLLTFIICYAGWRGKVHCVSIVSSICFFCSTCHCVIAVIIFIFIFLKLDASSLFFLKFYLFIYGCVGSSFLCEGFLWLRQVGATLHRGCAGLSLSWPLSLRSTGSRCAGSVIVAHGPSCSAACGIFPDQGSNPCPLHWQADSQPLRHQGSPQLSFLNSHLFYCLIVFIQQTLIEDLLCARHCSMHGRYGSK